MDPNVTPGRRKVTARKPIVRTAGSPRFEQCAKIPGVGLLTVRVTDLSGRVFWAIDDEIYVMDSGQASRLARIFLQAAHVADGWETDKA